MRWLCLTLALAALAACGGGDDRRGSPSAGGGATATATPPAPAAGAPGAGGVAAPGSVPDQLGKRLSRLCRAVQAKLETAPEPDDPKAAAVPAGTEREVLRELRRRMARFPIDDERVSAWEEYLGLLDQEIEVDRLIMLAGAAEDQPAIDDLNVQNGHNRSDRRRLALDDLNAKGCRPGTRITD